MSYTSKPSCVAQRSPCNNDINRNRRSIDCMTASQRMYRMNYYWASFTICTVDVHLSPCIPVQYTVACSFELWKCENHVVYIAWDFFRFPCIVLPAIHLHRLKRAICNWIPAWMPLSTRFVSFRLHWILERCVIFLLRTEFNGATRSLCKLSEKALNSECVCVWMCECEWRCVVSSHFDRKAIRQFFPPGLSQAHFFSPCIFSHLAHVQWCDAKHSK